MEYTHEKVIKGVHSKNTILSLRLLNRIDIEVDLTFSRVDLVFSTIS